MDAESRRRRDRKQLTAGARAARRSRTVRAHIRREGSEGSKGRIPVSIVQPNRLLKAQSVTDGGGRGPKGDGARDVIVGDRPTLRGLGRIQGTRAGTSARPRQRSGGPRKRVDSIRNELGVWR